MAARGGLEESDDEPGDFDELADLDEPDEPDELKKAEPLRESTPAGAQKNESGSSSERGLAH